MSDFSHVGVDANFSLFPAPARGRSYQTKDLPDSDDGACVDGDVRVDGLFVRQNGTANHSLNGWVRLIAEFGPYEFALRFQDGRAVEAIQGRHVPSGGVMAGRSPCDWRSVSEGE